MSAELVITERLADLLMLSHEPMFAWKLDGAIEFWNAGAERLYGFAANEAVGHSSHSLLKTKHPIDLAELRSQLRNARFWAGQLSKHAGRGMMMSALGQKLTYAVQNAMSALASIATAKADIRKRSRPLYPRKRTCAVQ
jgi:PAS domain S-box-containing protein